MKIFDNHPTFEQFIKNEIASLECISTRGLLSAFNDLDVIVNSSLSFYKSRIKKGIINNFDFHASFHMEVEKDVRKVVIGANVTNDFNECSYFLVIVNCDDSNEIIRKFHFDFAIPANATNQRVPIYHLQYGGKMSPKMQEENLKDTKLDHWLSVPRLNFSPVNIALLFDILLCEFKSVETNNIIQSSEWRSLIYKNECFLSANYFKAITEHIFSQNHKQSKLIRDFCYGE